MTMDASLKRIDRYLKSDGTNPLIVDVQNSCDLDTILTEFNVSENKCVDISTFCNEDELPKLEDIIHKFQGNTDNLFITGFTSLYKLLGFAEVQSALNTILHLPYLDGHLIILSFQLRKYLEFADPRLQRNIIIVDGENTVIPELFFWSSDLPKANEKTYLKGINHIGSAIEQGASTTINISTHKTKRSFPNAAYTICEIDSAFDAVVASNPELNILDVEYGTEEQWLYFLSLLQSNRSLRSLFNKEFGSCDSLHLAVSSYKNYEPMKKWLYFTGLKIFGAKSNYYLDTVIKAANTEKELVRCVFRKIMDIEYDNERFADVYNQRKELLNSLDNPIEEVIDYCKIIRQKESYAIYYLTDATTQEKELIFELINKYSEKISDDTLLETLKQIYPDLYLYLSKFEYGIPLLNQYFNMYKISKVRNHIQNELELLVNEQATERAFNLLLEHRTTKVEKIDKTKTGAYFVDALGVEYLSYIIGKCKEKGLFVNTILCKSNLPTITSINKEFLDDFNVSNVPVQSIKDLDEIKHHGIDEYDYTKTKLPIHIVRELAIIDGIIDNIHYNLLQNKFNKCIIISDHGASRLAVIKESENIWEMSLKGEHSGRCCKKDELDLKSEFAIETDDYWVLANYDRFKGSRKANVEVHGGATLEEVVVPIIEIVKKPEKIEVALVDREVLTGFKKTATLKLFISVPLPNIKICVEDIIFEATNSDENIYIIEMPSIKKAKTYFATVYSGENVIAEKLSFDVKKDSFKEKDIL